MKKYSPDIPHLYVRGKSFIFRLVIPAHLRGLAGKSEFKASLKTKDFSLALKKYGEVEPYYQSQLEKLHNGESLLGTTDLSYEELVKLAALQGRTYKPIGALLANPAEFIQVHSDWKKSGSPKGIALQSFFNTTSDSIKLSELVAFYEQDQVHVLTSLNDRERSKKINPLRNAVKQLIAFLDKDMELKLLTRQQAREYHRHLKTKIAGEEIEANTASKYITHLRVLIKTYNDAHDIEENTLFQGLNFKTVDNKRPPFGIDFLNENWFKKDVFLNLNPDARALLFAVIDTGCSFKELCGLTPQQDIKLDATVPHIIIQNNKSRALKTTHRKRIIPLTGYSLQSFKTFPDGFSAYATDNGPSNASSLINKFLRNNNLLETQDHSIYSLRHTFKDRMRAHRVPEELQHYLMGHKDQGMGSHYGTGYSLNESVTYLHLLAKDWKYFMPDEK